METTYSAMFNQYKNIQNPYSLKTWWSMIKLQHHSSYESKVALYESGLKYLPTNYKLWFHYLTEARKNLENQYENDSANNDNDKNTKLKYLQIKSYKYNIINNLHERALYNLPKMPRLWIDYLYFLISQNLITKTRQTFNKALQSLPITQHDILWEVYLPWATINNLTSIGINAYTRYLKLYPTRIEKFVSFLIEKRSYSLAIEKIIFILNDESFVSEMNMSHYDYWILMSDIILHNASFTDSDYELLNLNFELVIRHGLHKYSENIGKLWVALANFFIKQSLFDKARDIFEEGIIKVTTKKDFVLVYNAYLKFEEQVVENELYELGTEENNNKDTAEDDIMDLINKNKKAKDKKNDESKNENNSNKANKEATLEDEIDNLVSSTFNKLSINKTAFNTVTLSQETHKSLSLDSKLFKLSSLIERRPYLLSDLELRLNPNNITEWINRSDLCTDFDLKISIFEEALTTVDFTSSIGVPEDLIIKYSNFLIENNNLEKANEIFFKATINKEFNSESINNIYLNWILTHIDLKNYNSAREIVKIACLNRPNNSNRYLFNNSETNTLTISQSLNHKTANLNIDLWNLFADLEEQFGDYDSVVEVYEAMIQIKIANVITILNYTEYLESQKQFDSACKVYEQALSYFTWPQVYDLWLLYISKYENYYPKKIERIRDLFEQVISSAKKDQVKIFYYLYAKKEEEDGMISNCIKILEKCVNEVDKDEKIEVYSVLISKVSKYYGITKTRNYFVHALDNLEYDQITSIGIKFAALERKLGEINRARSVYSHLSQFCNPNSNEALVMFWQVWEEFELFHGNEQTYKEMLRIRRNVAHRFSLNSKPTVIGENGVREGKGNEL